MAGMSTDERLTVPSQIRALPTDRRGFLVPAETPGYDEGQEPPISKVSEIVNLCLGVARACSVCGLAMAQGEPVWRLHHERDAETDRELQQSQEMSNLQYVPGHASCMVYSAQACPFWRGPGARIRRDSQYVPGQPRGTAALIGYTDFALCLSPTGALQFVLWKALVDIPFDEPTSLVSPMREFLRTEKVGNHDRRVHYAPQFGGLRRLERDAQRARTTFTRASWSPIRVGQEEWRITTVPLP